MIIKRLNVIETDRTQRGGLVSKKSHLNKWHREKCQCIRWSKSCFKSETFSIAVGVKVFVPGRNAWKEKNMYLKDSDYITWQDFDILLQPNYLQWLSSPKNCINNMVNLISVLEMYGKLNTKVNQHCERSICITVDKVFGVLQQEPFSPITSGKSRRAGWLNYSIPIQASLALNQKLAGSVDRSLWCTHSEGRTSQKIHVCPTPGFKTSLSSFHRNERSSNSKAVSIGEGWWHLFTDPPMQFPAFFCHFVTNNNKRLQTILC